jgi:hypothetical protein
LAALSERRYNGARLEFAVPRKKFAQTAKKFAQTKS